MKDQYFLVHYSDLKRAWASAKFYPFTYIILRKKVDPKTKAKTLVYEGSLWGGWGNDPLAWEEFKKVKRGEV